MTQDEAWEGPPSHDTPVNDPLEPTFTSAVYPLLLDASYRPYYITVAIIFVTFIALYRGHSAWRRLVIFYKTCMIEFKNTIYSIHSYLQFYATTNTSALPSAPWLRLPMSAVAAVAALARATFETTFRSSWSATPLASNLSLRSHIASQASRTVRTIYPLGLGNRDNSCYQNSTIQGLASLVSLPAFLHHVIGTGPTSKSRTARSLQQTLHTLNTPRNHRITWLPDDLRIMDSYEQQDAQEYFTTILDLVDKEEIAQHSSQGGQDNRKYQSHNPIQGFTAQKVACIKCGHSDGLILTPFNILTLPLDPHDSCHIAQCLDEYTKVETIEDIECAKCSLLALQGHLAKVLGPSQGAGPASLQSRFMAVNAALRDNDLSDATLRDKCGLPKKLWTRTTKAKQTAIAQPPKCLILHANRTGFNEETFAMYKIFSKVSFPLEFDLGPWCIDKEILNATQSDKSASAQMQTPLLSGESGEQRRNYGPSEWLYELRANVVHLGRHDNGHYVCYRKYPSSDTFPGWWNLNDDYTTVSSADTVLKQGNIFMLFYELISETQGNEDVTLRMASGTALPVEYDTDYENSPEPQDGVVYSAKDMDIVKPAHQPTSADMLTSDKPPTNDENQPPSFPPIPPIPPMRTGTPKSRKKKRLNKTTRIK